MQVEDDKTRSSPASKTNMIAEILGILGETRRNKDWVIKEIKKHHMKMPAKKSMNSYELLNQCSSTFVSNLYRALKGESVEGFEDAQSLTKQYNWLFTDIVGGSNPTTPTKEQVRKIVVLNELISRTETFGNRDLNSTVILPVGDGVAIGFGDSIEKPLQLAIELHKALFRYNETKKAKERILIRIGIDMGPVYFVSDLNGKDNVWGPGIILTRRVMDLCGEMNIAASEGIATELRKLKPEYTKILHPIGNFEIKHGEELSIYNIYGTGFGNSSFPRKKKVLEPAEGSEIRPTNNFAFNKIGLKLEVLNVKTSLTRHTLIWDIVNISKKPQTTIFYFMDGDTEKEFSDMNVNIRDENNNSLDILAVSVNKPQHKEFNVQLKKPLPPKKRKTFLMEYDWEEPERTFFYRLPSSCKTLEYSFVAPNAIQPKIKIFNVDSVSGSRTEVVPPPSIANIKDKIAINWTKNDLAAAESYQFDW